MRGGAEAEAEVERFQFDTVLVPPEWQVQVGLRRSGRWEVLADSEKAVLLRRRVEPVGKKF
jgi:hypothetical protein